MSKNERRNREKEVRFISLPVMPSGYSEVRVRALSKLSITHSYNCISFPFSITKPIQMQISIWAIYEYYIGFEESITFTQYYF